MYFQIPPFSPRCARLLVITINQNSREQATKSARKITTAIFFDVDEFSDPEEVESDFDWAASFLLFGAALFSLLDSSLFESD